MKTINEPGFYFDMSAEDYFADPCPAPSLTQSIAKVIIDQSALHGYSEHPRLRPMSVEESDEKYIKAQAIGNAAHAILIGRGKTLAPAPFSNWVAKEARAFKSEQARLKRTPILEAHLTEAHNVVKAARRQLDQAGWADAFIAGNGEVVLCWQEDGIWLRTMIDWLSPHRLVSYDLKTTGASFAPHVIGRKMVDDGWDIQAAMHERGLNALHPEGAGRRRFRFIAIENYEPYALVPVELSETWLTMGRKKLQTAIDEWRGSMESGKWSAYPSHPITPEYPGYAERNWLEREIEHEQSRQREPMLTDLSGG